MFQVVESNAIFCLKIHKEIEYHFKYVEEQWRKKFSPGTHVVLGKCFPFVFKKLILSSNLLLLLAYIAYLHYC